MFQKGKLAKYRCTIKKRDMEKLYVRVLLCCFFQEPVCFQPDAGVGSRQGRKVMTPVCTCRFLVALCQKFSPFSLFSRVPHPPGTRFRRMYTIAHPQACEFSQAISWNTRAQVLGTEGRLCPAHGLLINPQQREHWII